MGYIEIKGDLIKLAKEGKFDVISHGCNCQTIMGAGIALEMVNNFDCHTFPLEHKRYKGNYNKLGQVDWDFIDEHNLFVVNSYTQYNPGPNLDYEALTLCMRKINSIFKGKKIGLPQIGCGIAGGNWDLVKLIIQEELKDCDVTVVIYDKQ